MEVIIFVFSVAGAFNVIEALLAVDTKEKISNYVFGLENGTFEKFESGLVETWLGIFLRDDRLVFSRIFVFVLFINLFVGLYIVLTEYIWYGFYPEDFSILVLYLLPLVFVGLIFEVINLKITKMVYLGRTSEFNFLAKFLLDVFFTTSVSFFVIYTIITIDNNWWYFLERPSYELLIISEAIVAATAPGIAIVMGAYLISRIGVLALGALVRFLSGFARVNFEVAVLSNVYNHPLTYLSLLLALIFKAGEYLISYFFS